MIFAGHKNSIGSFTHNDLQIFLGYNNKVRNVLVLDIFYIDVFLFVNRFSRTVGENCVCDTYLIENGIEVCSAMR